MLVIKWAKEEKKRQVAKVLVALKDKDLRDGKTEKDDNC